MKVSNLAIARSKESCNSSAGKLVDCQVMQMRNMRLRGVK
jgi:hypothetical protein